jgi:membrane protein CcdC involved in cytochrome C biogenesis
MDTKDIIYLVAFALILRVVVRVYFRYRKEQAETKDQDEE